MAKYYTGMTVRLQATFKDFDGTETDPTTVKVYWRDPSGEQQSATYVSNGTSGWTRSGTGVYAYDLSVLLPGPYTFGFQGTGAVAVYDSDSFEVNQRPAG